MKDDVKYPATIQKAVAFLILFLLPVIARANHGLEGLWIVMVIFVAFIVLAILFCILGLYHVFRYKETGRQRSLYISGFSALVLFVLALACKSFADGVLANGMMIIPFVIIGVLLFKEKKEVRSKAPNEESQDSSRETGQSS
jgi:hypothetical protein